MYESATKDGEADESPNKLYSAVMCSFTGPTVASKVVTCAKDYEKIVRDLLAYVLAHPRTAVPQGGRKPPTRHGLHTSLNVADAKNPIEDYANNESEARADSDQPQVSDQYTSLGCCPSSRLRQGKESKAQKPKTDTVVVYRICGKYVFDAVVNPITELTAAQGRCCKHRISGTQTKVNHKGSR